MKRVVVVLAILLWASVALGQVVIEGPDLVPPYKFVDLKISGEWESAVWEIEPAADADCRYSEDGKTLTFVAPPGTYTVRAVLANFSLKKLSQAKKAVKIGAKEPDPVNPPLPPVPGGQVQVMFFYERDKLDNLPDKQQAILGSLTLRKALEARGHVFLGTFDKDATGPKVVVPAAYAPWFQAVAGKTMPRVAVAPKAGGAIVDYDLPADEDALWTLLGGK